MFVFLKLDSWLRNSSHTRHVWAWLLGVPWLGDWLSPWKAQQWVQNGVYNSENKQQSLYLLQFGFNTCTMYIFSVSLHSQLHFTEKFSPAHPKRTSTLLNQTTFFRGSEARITHTLETSSVELNNSWFKDFIWSLLRAKFILECIFTKNMPLNICLLISIVIKKVLDQYSLNMQTSWWVGFCLFTTCHYNPAFVSQQWHSAVDPRAEL